MQSSLLLLIYCAGVVAASLAGGLLPHIMHLTHTRMQIALSFVAGAMLGVGLLHLVPHAYLLLGSIDHTMWFTLGGFLLMFFIERAFHFHHHSAPAEADSAEPAGHDHECAHGHHAHHTHSPTAAEAEHTHGAHAHHHHDDHGQAKVTWIAALVGLGLHSILDGVALAASAAADRAEHHDLAWAGFAVFLIVVLHKPFDSLTLGTLMAVGGRSAKLRHWVNAGYAAAVPIGVLLFHLGALSIGDAINFSVTGAVLAVAGGMFLCIATSDLLPELQFHTHDRFRLSAALLLGLALAGGIVLLEEHGHDHSSAPAAGAHRH